MIWQNQNVFPLLIINASGGFTGLFVYNPSPGAGNLILAIAGKAGTDPYGNAFASVLQVGKSGQGLTITDQFGNILMSGADGSQVLRLSPGNQRMLIYADPAAAGALRASIAIATALDDFGTVNVVPGFATYDANGIRSQLSAGVLSLFAVGGTGTAGTVQESAAGRLAIQSGLGTGVNQQQLFLFDNNASPFGTQAFQVANSGSVFDAQGQSFLEGQTLIGATAAGTTAGLELHGFMALLQHAAPGTPPATFGFLYMDLAGNLHFKNVGGIDIQITPALFSGNLPVVQTDTTDRTVTAITSTQLSNQFTIPAADALAGTVYILTCGGTGTQATTTAVLLTLQDVLAGASVNQVNVSATGAIPAGTPFDWELRTVLVVKTTGVSGACNIRQTLWMSVNNAAANTSNGITAVRRVAGQAINTTIANTFQNNALWGSATGSPTITCNNSIFERQGPD